MEVFFHPLGPTCLTSAPTSHSGVGGASGDSRNGERFTNLSIREPIKVDSVNQNNTGKAFQIKALKQKTYFGFFNLTKSREICVSSYKSTNVFL